jgi:hypothetical protein
VNVGALDATVTENKTDMAGCCAEHSDSNAIAGSFGNTGGVSIAAQNVGHNSMVEQNVNVQANLSRAPQ